MTQLDVSEAALARDADCAAEQCPGGAGVIGHDAAVIHNWQRYVESSEHPLAEHHQRKNADDRCRATRHEIFRGMIESPLEHVPPSPEVVARGGGMRGYVRVPLLLTSVARHDHRSESRIRSARRRFHADR